MYTDRQTDRQKDKKTDIIAGSTGCCNIWENFLDKSLFFFLLQNKSFFLRQNKGNVEDWTSEENFFWSKICFFAVLRSALFEDLIYSIICGSSSCRVGS